MTKKASFSSIYLLPLNRVVDTVLILRRKYHLPLRYHENYCLLNRKLNDLITLTAYML